MSHTAADIIDEACTHAAPCVADALREYRRAAASGAADAIRDAAEELAHYAQTLVDLLEEADQ
ncbi:hypothetical protein [Nocardia wallacei]|uniref:hypothetical protein n=1 Tax=Nocardia wallacei TaxID=480035 RepID=UPI0024576E74|nr:hypothetical protein [Nocardia wallacei]